MWSDWGECSKGCDTGFKSRFREVEKEAGPTGFCPEADSEDRLGEEWCNEMPCPPDVACFDKLDIVVLVDGSGSVEWTKNGWKNEKKFTERLLGYLEMGEHASKAGVVLFSWEAELIQELTTDRAALMASVEGMQWPGWNTDTAAGIMMAATTLTNGGRPDVSKENSIAFLITDGNPNDMTATNSAAEDLKERARLIVVTVGNNVDENAVNRWASWPAEENVMNVEDFGALQDKLSEFVSDICLKLGCKETFTGNGQDYTGCQSTTRSGYSCQRWIEQTPHGHRFLPQRFPDSHIGDHNFCRNPDGDSTIWCYTADPSRRWEFCDPRDTNAIPTDFSYSLGEF
jgi:uncharacterized protein YegL